MEELIQSPGRGGFFPQTERECVHFTQGIITWLFNQDIDAFEYCGSLNLLSWLQFKPSIQFSGELKLLNTALQYQY